MIELSADQWTTIIVAGIGGAGVVTAIVKGLFTLLEARPSKQQQEAAVEEIAAPEEEQQARAMTRVLLAAQADMVRRMAEYESELQKMKTEQEKLRKERDKAREERETARAERDQAIRERNIYYEWVMDVYGRWHVVRLSETAPPKPEI